MFGANFQITAKARITAARGVHATSRRFLHWEPVHRPITANTGTTVNPAAVCLNKAAAMNKADQSMTSERRGCGSVSKPRYRTVKAIAENAKAVRSGRVSVK